MWRRIKLVLFLYYIMCQSKLYLYFINSAITCLHFRLPSWTFGCTTIMWTLRDILNKFTKCHRHLEKFPRYLGICRLRQRAFVEPYHSITIQLDQFPCRTFQNLVNSVQKKLALNRYRPWESYVNQLDRCDLPW